MTNSTIDPDMLAIWRRRRQQRRCLHCNKPTPRAALCKTCRQTRRYCPRCEVVWVIPAPRPTPNGRSTEYCFPCANLVRNGPRPTRAVYDEQQRERRHPLLGSIIKRYKSGQTYDTIAAALDIPRGTLTSIIVHARKTGRWPARLVRGRNWRWKGSQA
jgi:hypothetical protein